MLVIAAADGDEGLKGGQGQLPKYDGLEV